MLRLVKDFAPFVGCLMVGVTAAHADPALSKPGGYGLGRLATPDEIAAWDLDVRPDGLGLPEGSGDVATGEDVFAESCAMCHGDFGEGVDRWPVLAGGAGTLTSDRPDRTIGSYWPYLSTVYDYIHRAMPFGAARTLSDDDVYAITAYLLYMNDIVDEEFELSKANFTDVEMPNAGGFFMDDRADGELKEFTEPVCMENCKPAVEITARAAVIDVTPEDAEARKAREAKQAAVPMAPTVAVAAAEPTLDPDLVAAGEKVFKKCGACHQVGAGASNKTGPELNGVVGRTAGSVAGFKYSKDMEAAGAGGLVWSQDQLAAFLAKPKDVISGTKMAFAGLRKDEDIAAVIAYLEAQNP